MGLRYGVASQKILPKIFRICSEELVISYILVYVYCKCMGFLLFHRKNRCEICHRAFDKREHLIKHAKEEHHKPILKCPNCNMQFLYERDRLHHIQEEKKKKIDLRRHR